MPVPSVLKGFDYIRQELEAQYAETPLREALGIEKPCTSR